jgi:hypothetical protein
VDIQYNCSNNKLQRSRRHDGFFRHLASAAASPLSLLFEVERSSHEQILDEPAKGDRVLKTGQGRL